MQTTSGFGSAPKMVELCDGVKKQHANMCNTQDTVPTYLVGASGHSTRRSLVKTDKVSSNGLK